jgi:hypothetical protein
MITVNNSAPVVGTLTGSTIDENAIATVSGTFTDAGSDDSFTVTINWGENDPVEYGYPAGSTSFSQTHQYLDDNPTGESGHVYPVAVQIVDNDDGIANAATEVTVNNRSPVAGIDVVRDAITGKSLAYIGRDGVAVMGEIGVVLAGAAIEVAGSYSDAGTLDTHTAGIDWDDGTVDPVGISSAGETDAVNHTYAPDQAPGDYVIALTISDDDTGVDTPTATIRVVDGAGAVLDLAGVLQGLMGEGLEPAAVLQMENARDNLIGNNGGTASNGALDKLEQGNLNAAMIQMRQVLQALEAAQAADAGLDLSAAITQLVLSARSVAVDAIAAAETVADKPNERRKIAEALALVDSGDTALADPDYATALDAYGDAVRAVQGIK